MKNDDYAHTPVLKQEVLHGLDIRPGGIYVDCTYGRGGHSRAVLERLGGEGKLFVFDRDPDAVRDAEQLAAGDSRVRSFHAPFSTLFRRLEEYGVAGNVDGVLFDLGISSTQVDNPERGFSFLQEGYLDMRMNPAAEMSAADWINAVSEDDLAKVLRVYGEERFARRIARAIVRAREIQPVSTTTRLAEIIMEAVPVRGQKRHPATRSFQAIRIFINNELEEISRGLIQAFDILRIRGRMVVISFHSLEDRIVKRFMREYSAGDPYPKEVPVRADMLKPRLRRIGKAIRPGPAEISANPRARSAVLRTGEKLAL